MKHRIYGPPELQIVVIVAEKGFAISQDYGTLEGIEGEIEGEW